MDYKNIYEIYSNEIMSIKNDIRQLTNEKFYENTKNRSDGKVYTIAKRLESKIDALLLKINNNATGDNEKNKREYDKFFNK